MTAKDKGGRSGKSPDAISQAKFSTGQTKPSPGLRFKLRQSARHSDVARKLPPSQLTPPVLDAIGSMSARIDELNHKLVQAEAHSLEMKELADRDPLLGIFNRRAFERELVRTAAFARRYGAKASLVFIDLNKFKWINDVYGHKAGDMVLEHVSKIIETNTRRSDVFGRLGGDEFGVILAQVDGALALKKAERLEAMIATTPVEVNGITLLLTASAGAADVTGEGTLEELMERADQAMYMRKEAYHAADSR